MPGEARREPDRYYTTPPVSEKAASFYPTRMKKKLLPLCLVSLSLLSPPQALAWNDTGHKIVARIAWEHMRPDVRRRVIALLDQAPPA